MSLDKTPDRERPEAIQAVPVRHPGRWVAVAVLLVLCAQFVHMLVTNKAFHWSYIVDNAFRPNVIEGVRTIIVITVLAMVFGTLIGVIVAVMRLSDNPVLRTVAWLYTWFFRAAPRYVLLVLFGNLGILYAEYSVGFPFTAQLADLMGVDINGTLFTLDANTVLSAFSAGVLALSLSEGAYMGEIIRGGLLSVNPGQSEAAAALGMSKFQITRRIVLPQAMKVVLPPTGNETIAMLKDTSLLSAIPLTTELFFQLRAQGTRDFLPFPMLVASLLWYVAIASFLMVGQYYLERHYSKGDRRLGR